MKSQAPESKKDNVKYDLTPTGQLRAKMVVENDFDRLFNKGVINEIQLRAGDDYYFNWYNGVVAIHGCITMNYEVAGGGGGGGGMTLSEFQLNCREAYKNLGSLLEPEARALLDKICEGNRAPEIEKQNEWPRYYAYARMKSALNVIATHKGYMKRGL